MLEAVRGAVASAAMLCVAACGGPTRLSDNGILDPAEAATVARRHEA
ncbi:hypothetical protein [Microvirga sp. VF16]